MNVFFQCLWKLFLMVLQSQIDGSSVNFFGFNLEVLGLEIIENITTLGLLKISSVVCLFKLQGY